MLVLASASPRRRELLATLGIDHHVQPADIDETPLPGESAAAHVERLARSKAEAVAAQRPASDWVLAADTVVVLDGQILGKPSDQQAALVMLRSLSGRRHRVRTGVALCRGQEGPTESMSVVTDVEMVPASEHALQRYVESGEPMDKAGAYAIQGLGGGFIRAIDGSYSNVVGLPTAAVIDLLWRHGALAAWP